MPLCRLVYISENNLDPLQGGVVRQLADILGASNRNNSASQITGALIFDDMWFLQALEGERQALWAKFERIREDERHANVMLVEMVEIQQRLFGNWWMGLAKRSGETEHLFARHVRHGRFRADTMSAKEIVALMEALSVFGLQRVIATAA